LRKKTAYRKFGHTGTLDPFASGLVILCLNKATKLSSFIINSNKDYLVKIELGKKTDTGDRDGNIILQEEPSLPSKDIVDKAINQIRNLRTQVPPSYSAKKINGKAAYKYARKGIQLNLQPQKITIHSFDIISFTDNIIVYRTKVSKGTYIRTLSETFAEYLGNIAYTKDLRRFSIGNISVKDAVKPSSLNADNWQKYLKPINSLKWDYPIIHLKKREICRFMVGNTVKLSESFYDDHRNEYLANHCELKENQVIVFAAEAYNEIIENDCLGIAHIDKNNLYPKKVL